jgi:hypothetical protein
MPFSDDRASAVPPYGRTQHSRGRRPSRTRRLFLTAIGAQLAGTRLLASLTFLVLVAGGCFWLVGTAGSPLIGVSFIVLAAVLALTVYWFVRVMTLLSGRR